ncbi:MAG: flagellar modification protein B, partial [Actinobacteria bacterium]|nr:flagellar modification protein B [Actinomycetota bacterium]
TGCRSRRSPYFNLVELTPNGEVELAKQTELPIRRRQDAPITFDMNASIYVWQRDELFASDDVVRKGTRLFEMPESRSHDIDTELDFQIVELLLMAQSS